MIMLKGKAAPGGKFEGEIVSNAPVPHRFAKMIAEGRGDELGVLTKKPTSVPSIPQPNEGADQAQAAVGPARLGRGRGRARFLNKVNKPSLDDEDDGPGSINIQWGPGFKTFASLFASTEEETDEDKWSMQTLKTSSAKSSSGPQTLDKPSTSKRSVFAGVDLDELVASDDFQGLLKEVDKLDPEIVLDKHAKPTTKKVDVPEDPMGWIPDDPGFTPSIPKIGITITMDKPKRSGSSGGVNKRSGYIMFLQDMHRKTGGTKGSDVNSLIREYDHHWKELPEDQKALWKVKARSGAQSSYESAKSNLPGPSSTSAAPRHHSRSGEGFTRKPIHEQEETFGDDDEDDYY